MALGWLTRSATVTKLAIAGATVATVAATTVAAVRLVDEPPAPVVVQQGAHIPPTTGTGRHCEGSGAGGWTFEAYVSDNDGLVLANSSLNGRRFTRQISVPYVRTLTEKVSRPAGGGIKIDDDWLRIELTPEPSFAHDGIIGTTLDDFDCVASGDDEISVTARFVAKDIFRRRVGFGKQFPDTLTFTQVYRFRNDGHICEPSGELRCARFWPTVAYRYDGPRPSPGPSSGASPPVPEVPNPSSGQRNPYPYFKGAGVLQRMDFNPDATTAGSIDAFADDLSVRPGGLAGVEPKGSGSNTHSAMPQEASGRAIVRGRKGQWDSIHQSPSETASLPGTALWHLAPGCPACVHMHWRWGLAANTPDLGDVATGGVADHLRFTDGRPEILPGSAQDAEFGIVRFEDRRDEADPVMGDWHDLIDGGGRRAGSLTGQPPVIFWDMTSAGTADSTFPKLDSWDHGGDGGIFFGTDVPLDTVGGHVPPPVTTTSAPRQGFTREQIIAAAPRPEDLGAGYTLVSSAVDQPEQHEGHGEIISGDASCADDESGGKPAPVPITSTALRGSQVGVGVRRHLVEGGGAKQALQEIEREARRCGQFVYQWYPASGGKGGIMNESNVVVDAPPIGDASVVVRRATLNELTGASFASYVIVSVTANAVTRIDVVIPSTSEVALDDVVSIARKIDHRLTGR